MKHLTTLVVDNDPTMSANSANLVPSQQATKALINTIASGGGVPPTTSASDLTTGTLDPARIGNSSLPLTKLASVSDNSYATKNNSTANWGDSLTFGTGGSTTPTYPGGIPYMVHFRNITGYNFFNGGVPGNSSTQIRDRMLAATDKYSWSTIIWAGANNPDQTAVLADVASMVAALGHNRFLVAGIVGQSSPAYWQGSGGYSNIQSINAALASTYGVRFVDLRTALVAAFDPNSPQDVTDNSHDIPPTSLFYPGDVTHFNDNGYKVIAATFATKKQYLFPSGTVITSGSQYDIFTSPLGIGTVTPNVGRFTNVAIGKPLESALYLDGGNGNSQTVLDLIGSARFSHPAASNPYGGLLIRPRYPDEGGYASMEITGTNPNVWPSGSGIVVANHARNIFIGSDAAPVQLILKGATVLPSDTSIGAISSTQLNYLVGLTSGIQGQIDAKQSVLTSGTNIKTINGASILGSGNIAINLQTDATPISGSVNALQSGGAFTALAGKAAVNSPAFTGVPTTPTAAAGTNTTQIASTAFVLGNIPTSYLDKSQYSGDGLTEATKLSIANISASVITTGTVAMERLPNSVAYKDGTNTFTGANTFGDLNVSNLVMAGGILSNNISSQYALFAANNAKLRVGIAELNGSLELFTADAGIFIKSANGTRYKITISNAGVLTPVAAP